MINSKVLVNPRIIGIMVVAASVLLVTTGSQNAMASAPIPCPPVCPDADVDVEEAAEAGNASMTAGDMNQIANATNGVKFLSIQNAQSGSISELNATAYTLELNDISDKTILFSDRPDRIVTSISTSDFVGNWTAGADSFAADPPNAVLILHDEERQDIDIIEHFNPVYDPDANILKYDIIPVNATSIELPSEFGQSTLVIDDKNNPGSGDMGPGW